MAVSHKSKQIAIIMGAVTTKALVFSFHERTRLSPFFSG